MSNNDPSIRRLASNNKVRTFAAAAAAAMLLEACTTGGSTPAPKTSTVTVYKTVTPSPTKSKETPSSQPKETQQERIAAAELNKTGKQVAIDALHQMADPKIQVIQYGSAFIGNKPQTVSRGDGIFPGYDASYGKSKQGEATITISAGTNYGDKNSNFQSFTLQFGLSDAQVRHYDTIVASGREFTPTDLLSGLQDATTQLVDAELFSGSSTVHLTTTPAGVHSGGDLLPDSRVIETVGHFNAGLRHAEAALTSAFEQY